MAKKSNKTDHVLSLLSGGGKEKTENKDSAVPKPPVEPEVDKAVSSVSIVQSSSEKEGLAETIKKSLEEELEKMEPEAADAEEGTEAEKIAQMLSEEPEEEPVSITDMESELERPPIKEDVLEREPRRGEKSQKKDAPEREKTQGVMTQEQIQALLEANAAQEAKAPERESDQESKELEQERAQEAKEPAQEKAQESKAPEPGRTQGVMTQEQIQALLEANAVEEMPSEQGKAQEAMAPEPDKVEGVKAPEKTQGVMTQEQIQALLEANAAQEETAPKQTEEQERVQEPIKQDTKTGKEEKEEQEENFAFINVMERLVRDKVVDYMKQFGNCTCSRCVADTTALALTQLPPKYVVINKETVSPLMNFYTKKYAGQITVEITKACIRVGEMPHHSRE